ncbi:MAG TPA: hypothetical protein VHA35_20555 [Dongiaceae bacterium]|jgi:hypothetical protein|nr:hypothetical protein [Dongiaceae bacterium]
MLDYLGHSLAASLCFGFAAGITWWLLTRFLDVLAGGWRHFKKADVLGIIHGDARATAHYYGCRLIAAAVVVGLVLSSVRF